MKLFALFYFEDHRFGGHISSIEEFTNVNLDTVRTTIINGRPYFCAIDLCKGLCLSSRAAEISANECIASVRNYLMSISDTPEIQFRRCEYININDLYYLINLEISHYAHNAGNVKQSVPTMFVSEPVLYMMMFRSRKKEAELFKAWLAVDILPFLRKLGKEKATVLVQNESIKMMETLNEINNKYDEIKDLLLKNNETVGKYFEQSMQFKSQSDYNEYIINNNVCNLMNKTDILGYNMLSDIEVLNNKVTNIATGLNAVFCK